MSKKQQDVFAYVVFAVIVALVLVAFALVAANQSRQYNHLTIQ